MRIEAEYQVFEGGIVFDSRDKGPIRGDVERIIRALRGRHISQFSFAVLQVASAQDCRRLADMLLQLEHCFNRKAIPEATIWEDAEEVKQQRLKETKRLKQ